MPFDAVAQLASTGYDVRVCTGRSGAAPECPPRAGGECPLAAGADAILVGLPEGPGRSELLDAHHARHPDVPVAIIDRRRGHPVTADGLSAAARAALGRRPGHHAQDDAPPDTT